VSTQKKNIEFPEIYATEYQKRKLEIEKRLQDFLNIPEKDWFYEACYCILTPQSKAVHAELVVQKLIESNYEFEDLDPMPLLRNPEHYIRFHNQKTVNLQLLKEQFPEIKSMILEFRSKPLILRDLLTHKIRGFGMKESAHFMRNIGIFGPTILDRHILKHLLACGIKSAKNAPTNKSMYLRIEKAWLKYCRAVNIDMESMDLLFWSMETGFILK
jgi:N-glycosylase/DNA lyase